MADLRAVVEQLRRKETSWIEQSKHWVASLAEAEEADDESCLPLPESESQQRNAPGGRSSRRRRRAKDENCRARLRVCPFCCADFPRRRRRSTDATQDKAARLCDRSGTSGCGASKLFFQLLTPPMSYRGFWVQLPQGGNGSSGHRIADGRKTAKAFFADCRIHPMELGCSAVAGPSSRIRGDN